MEITAIVYPAQDGCWYCYTTKDGGWLYSHEFDCNLHLACLQAEIVKNNGAENSELEIFMNEFRDILKEN